MDRDQRARCDRCGERKEVFRVLDPRGEIVCGDCRMKELADKLLRTLPR